MNIRKLSRIAIVSLLLLTGACSTGPQPQPGDYAEPIFTLERVKSEESVDPQLVYDPWEGMNQRIYTFNYHFDQKIFLPVVRGWRAVVPRFIRVGLNNFLNNLRDIVTIANSILQLAPEKTFQASGRVIVNSTVGLFGVIDVASKLDFPRPREDFGQTLGRWGVGKGPYLVLPFLGPSNVRDAIGYLPDLFLIQMVNDEVLSKPLRATYFLFNAIDTRSNVSFRYHETGSAFEYDTVRWLYSTKRDLDVIK
jgi:phospholipid-binding lipoprotein MlaA